MSLSSYPRILLLILGLLAFLPFINRPLFVDDHAHFAQAERLAQNEKLYADSQLPNWRKNETPTEANPLTYFYFMSF
jgi:hypothetical protein